MPKKKQMEPNLPPIPEPNYGFPPENFQGFPPQQYPQPPIPPKIPTQGMRGSSKTATGKILKAEVDDKGEFYYIIVSKDILSLGNCQISQ